MCAEVDIPHKSDGVLKTGLTPLVAFSHVGGDALVS